MQTHQVPRTGGGRFHVGIVLVRSGAYMSFSFRHRRISLLTLSLNLNVGMLATLWPDPTDGPPRPPSPARLALRARSALADRGPVDPSVPFGAVAAPGALWRRVVRGGGSVVEDEESVEKAPKL